MKKEETKRTATIYDLKRFCAAHSQPRMNCKECPLADVDCDVTCANDSDMEIINDEVIKWCDEHPIKTRQSELLKLFPKASLDWNGVVDICPARTGEFPGSRCNGLCSNCRRNFWQEEII